MNENQFIKDFELLFDEVETGTFTLETIFREQDEWSSLVSLTLIAMVDENYNVKLSGDDIRNSHTISDVYNKVLVKINV
jgi:acyl carrier protein